METLRPNEVAKILKLHSFTVTRLAREKKIPGFKVGGAIKNMPLRKLQRGNVWHMAFSSYSSRRIGA